MRRLIFLLAIGLLTFLFVVIPFARNSETRLVALDAATGEIRWSNELPDSHRTLGSAVVTADRLFLQTTTRVNANSYRWQLEMLDVASGRKQWTFRPEKDTYQFWNFSVPLFATAKTVYASIDSDPDRFNQLLAIDAETGKLRWAIDRLWSSNTLDREYGISLGSIDLGVVEQGDRVVVISPSRDGKTQLQAVDWQTGKSIWQVEFDSFDVEYFSLFTPPQRLVASDRAVFFLDNWGTIHAHDLATGRSLFTVASPFSAGETTYALDGELAIAEENLYRISSRFAEPNPDVSSSALQAFDSATGEVRWSRSGTGNQCDQGVGYIKLQASADYLATICNDRTGILLSVLDLNEGYRRWSKNVSFYPAFNSQLIFAKDRDAEPLTSRMVALSAQDGREQWQFPKTPSSGISLYDPIAQGDRVFVTLSTTRWQNLLLRLHLAR